MSEGEIIFVKGKMKDTEANRNKTLKIIEQPLHYNEYYLEEPSDFKAIDKLENDYRDKPYI